MMVYKGHFTQGFQPTKEIVIANPTESQGVHENSMLVKSTIKLANHYVFATQSDN